MKLGMTWGYWGQRPPADIAGVSQEADLPRYVVAGGMKLVPCELPVPELFQSIPLEMFTAIALPAGLLTPPVVAERAAAIPLLRALVALTERL